MNKFINRKAQDLNKKILEVEEIERGSDGEITKIVGTLVRADTPEIEGTALNAENMNSIIKKMINNTVIEILSSNEENNGVILPILEENQTLKSNDINYTKHTTKPPARYTESKLIKEMETLGIGRPSTYATTIGILSERGYVKIIEKKKAIKGKEKPNAFFIKVFEICAE